MMKVIIRGGKPVVPIRKTIPKNVNLAKELPKFVETLSYCNPGVLSCQVGKGKTYGVVHGVLPWAIERGLRILYISSRVANNDQLKAEIIEVTGQRDILDKLTAAGIREKEDFGSISVLSYHTRLDAAEGGVNDTLCRVLGIVDAVPFGEEAVGRIGILRAPATLAAFCNTCKDVLGSPVVHCVSAKKPVSRVAVLGGGGGDDWMNALKAGADTYVTGSIGYNALLGAKAEGLNVIMAGHYYTEVPVLDTLKAWLSELCPEVEALCAETPCEVLTV